MRSSVFLLVVAAWTSSSCGANPNTKGHRPDPSEPHRELRVWIQEDPRMPKDVVMRGCLAWNTRNVSCRQVETEAEGQVKIYASDDVCVTIDAKTRKKDTTLAWAFAGGKIKMMAKCFDYVSGVFDSQALSAVTTHEIGHQFGIWEHVPKSCDEKDVATHRKTGHKICGTAVMNPHYDQKVSVPTEIDILAFEERDRIYSVLVSDTPDKEVCDYHRIPAP